MSILSVLLSDESPLERMLLDAGFVADEGPLGEWTRGSLRYTPGLECHSLRADRRQPTELEPGFNGEVSANGLVDVRRRVPRQQGDDAGPYRSVSGFNVSEAWLRRASARERATLADLEAKLSVWATDERVSIVLTCPTSEHPAVLSRAAALLETLIADCARP